MKVAKSLTTLYNYWLVGEGIPIIQTTARNFFIFKGNTETRSCTIDQLRPISATSILFKMLEMIIKNRVETSIKTKRIRQIYLA